MVSFTEILPIILRAFISFALLLLLAKLMGAKQISQMTFFDYIVGISIGSIAAVLAIDDQIPAVYPIAAMVIYALLDLALSVITSKSIVARRFFTGTPTIIIDNGKIIRENMVRTHYDMNDLLSLCRTKGFYNVSDIVKINDGTKLLRKLIILARGYVGGEHHLLALKAHGIRKHQLGERGAVGAAALFTQYL